MIASPFGSRWVRDVPICLPGRECVDESPAAGPLMHVTSALTPLSPAIAAACLILIGAAVVLVGQGVMRQRRGGGVRPSLVMLAVALLLAGLATATAISARLAMISGIYGGEDGLPSAPAPSSVIGSWPSVLGSGWAMAAVAGLALLVISVTEVVRRRRPEGRGGSAAGREGSAPGSTRQ